MASGNDPTVEGFVDAVRFAWTVHLLLIHDMVDAREAIPNASPKDLDYLQSCLEVIFSHNAFQFLLQEVIQTAAYQVSIFCFKTILQEYSFCCSHTNA